MRGIGVAMGLELLQASTADALTITGISRRSFHSDVEFHLLLQKAVKPL
jgi:hypothetical protein